MPTLYRVQETADLFVDACIRDGGGHLLWLSLFGRDTSITQLFAQLTLPISQGGLETLTLVREGEAPQPVSLSQPDRLEKVTGRLPHNLFGNLVHCWIFDPRIKTPDRANGKAWLLYESELDGVPIEACWQLIKHLSAVPLLDDWQDPLWALLHSTLIIDPERSSYPPLGRMQAVQIRLPDGFPALISQLIQSGQLPVPDEGRPIIARQVGVNPVAVAPIRFDLGRQVMTCGVDEALQCGAIKMHWLADCIRRHARGDWGSVPKSDAALNLAALTPGDEGRLMSVYPLPTAVDGETTIWIITEWDRSVTTILLPSEY
ncbi:hypothetical protein [Parachitinimonas caeni]|nr:hypothetical protein [Parachitinimonas caeni]